MLFCCFVFMFVFLLKVDVLPFDSDVFVNYDDSCQKKQKINKQQNILRIYFHICSYFSVDP